jgi:hypothetical protein
LTDRQQKRAGGKAKVKRGDARGQRKESYSTYSSARTLRGFYLFGHFHFYFF